MNRNDSRIGNPPKAIVARRAIFTLVTAVAAFGVAMGVQADGAWGKEKEKKKKKDEIQLESFSFGITQQKTDNKREGTKTMKFDTNNVRK